MKFKIVSLNVSDRKGVEKHPVQEIILVENVGVERDAHAGTPNQQVSLLAAEEINRMKECDSELTCGSYAENITKLSNCVANESLVGWNNGQRQYKNSSWS